MAKQDLSGDPPIIRGSDIDLSGVDMGTDERKPTNGKSAGPLQKVAGMASDVAEGVTDLARGVPEGVTDLARALPEGVDRATSQTGRALGEAQRAMQRGSDSGLLAGASLTAGLALGLLVGRVPRPLVLLAMVPAVALGFTLAERSSSERRLEESPIVH